MTAARLAITAIAAALVLGNGSALAQGSRRMILIDLSFAIGESHALRQVCRGAEDQYWRDRMQRVLEAERPSPGEAQRLRTAFNNGYLSAQAEHRRCTQQSRTAETAAAQRGADLAKRLAQSEPEDPLQ